MLIGWLFSGARREQIATRMHDSFVPFRKGKGMAISASKTFYTNGSRSVFSIRLEQNRINLRSKILQLSRGEIMAKLMTRRAAIGYVSSFYDPLGLCLELLISEREAFCEFVWSRLVTANSDIQCDRDL